MLKSLPFKPLFLNLIQITTIPFKTLKLNSSLSTLSLNHNSSTTSQQTQFKASKLVQFGTPEKFNSVIDIFKIYGFSDTQINQIVKQAPNIVNCDPNKRILPKFEFLSSKGASNSEIVEIVCRSPRILYSSLENNIIPTFELVRRFIPSDKKVIERILRCKFFFGHYNVIKNVNLLLDEGVTDSNIRCLLLKRPSILLCSDMIMRNALNVVKEMGFNDPSNVNFVIALLAIGAMSKSRWDAKVVVFKRWGWSEEMVLEAFRKRALCMLVSVEKINKVMRFWVNELDWNSSALVKRPEIFSYSLENRIIPRASVVSYLISKGLIEKNVELSTPFSVIEKVFLEKYVHCFKEERHDLLKLYQEKMDV
jgi:mTERF domain-containing protein